MKRLLALWLALLCLSGCAAAEEAFRIDQDYLQPGMGRSYAQRYTPSIAQNQMILVLPIESDRAAGDITAALVPEDPSVSPVQLGQAMSQRLSRKKLASGEAGPYVAQFKLKLHPDRLNGEYPCHVHVEGKDAAGQKLSQRFDLLLTITDGVKNPASPLPVMTGLSPLSPLQVGQAGELRLKFHNASRTRMLLASSLRLSDPSGDILPAGSDTLALGDLLPGEERELALPVQVLDKAAAQPHALSLSLSGVSAEGTPVTQSQQFTLNVQQEARLRLGDSQLPQQATQGENLAYALNFMNMGKGKLNNILMRFDLPGLNAGGSVLVGNLAAGESKLGSANLRVGTDVLGEVRGRLLIEYEDDYGRPYSQELPLSITVAEKPKPVFTAVGDKQEKEEKEKTPTDYVPWGLAGLMLMLLVIQSILLRRRIRQLEERNL